MSQFDTSLAKVAYGYAILYVQRQIFFRRFLAPFSKRHRRLLVINRIEEKALLARESKLGKRKPSCDAFSDDTQAIHRKIDKT